MANSDIVGAVQKIAHTKIIEERLGKLEQNKVEPDKGTIDGTRNVAVQNQDGNITKTPAPPPYIPPPPDVPPPPTPEVPPPGDGGDKVPPTAGGAKNYGNKGAGDTTLQDIITELTAAGYSAAQIDAFLQNYLNDKYGEDGVYRAEEILDKSWKPGDYLRGIIGFDENDPTLAAMARFDGQYNDQTGWPDPWTPGPAPGYINGIFWRNTTSSTSFDSYLACISDIIANTPAISQWTGDFDSGSNGYVSPGAVAAYLQGLDPASNANGITYAQFSRVSNPELGNIEMAVIGFLCGRAGGVSGGAGCTIAPDATEWQNDDIYILSRVDGLLTPNQYNGQMPLRFLQTPGIASMTMKVGDGTNILDNRKLKISIDGSPNSVTKGWWKIEELSSTNKVLSTLYFLDNPNFGKKANSNG